MNRWLPLQRLRSEVSSISLAFTAVACLAACLGARSSGLPELSAKEMLGAVSADADAGPPYGWDLSGSGGQPRRVSAIADLRQNEWNTIVDIRGAGIITHLWFTFPPQDENFGRRNLMRIFWDDDEVPGVVAPLSDFFGFPFGYTGKEYRIDSEFLAAPPGNGLNCYFRMPFSKRARIEIFAEQRESGGGFYVQADYLAFDEGLPRSCETLRFCAQFRFESPTESYGSHYLFVDATGPGVLLGVTFGIELNYPAPDAWFHGGGDTIFVDGEGKPSVLHGIGAEDFFGFSWGVSVFGGRYTGVPWQEVDDSGRIRRLSLYRFFVRDPVPFRSSIRGLLGAIGHNMSSVAYWYQMGPVVPFFRVPKADGRMPQSRAPRGTYDVEPGKGLQWKLLAPFAISASEPFDLPRGFEKQERGDESFTYPVSRGNVGRAIPTRPGGDRIEVQWKERAAFHQFVDFNEIARPAVQLISLQKGVLGYALAYLDSEAERDVWLYLGFDDELQLRLNDAVLFRGLHGNGFAEERVRIHLKRGSNRVLVKLSNDDNSTWRLWAFSFRTAPVE
jgi:hypothetical protein